MFWVKKSDVSVRVHIPVTKGSLSYQRNDERVGYHIADSVRKRHAVLNGLIREASKDALMIHRALVARRTLGKNRFTDEQIARLTDDIEYIAKRYKGSEHWNKKIK